MVLINMDMPKNCFTVENKRFKYCKLYDGCEYKDLRYGNIPSDCPLKSVDEMIAEINNLQFIHTEMEYNGAIKKVISKDDVLEIINKYCSKENTNENQGNRDRV